MAKEEAAIAVSGLAHVQLTVRDMERSVPFWRRLLQALGMTILLDAPTFFYCVGARTGVALSPADAEHADEPFHQRRVGLHHLCFRAKSRKDVDALHRVALELGARIVHGPREDGFAPGYYSVLFEDPDGIRVEANHVPGKGLLAPGAGPIGPGLTGEG